MQEALVVILILAGVALAITIGYFAHKAEKERQAALEALAVELGLVLDAPRREPGAEHKRFGPFNQGHSRYRMNTMTGSIPCIGLHFPVIMGDYEYKVTTSNGKTTTTVTYRFSYILLRVPLDVPDLSIRPEGLFDKIAGAMGFDDIDFESAEFSRKFHVKSPDKRFAYDVIDPRMMEFLLATGGRAIQIEGGVILVHQGTRRWDPPEFRSQLAFAREFFEHWPEHVVKARSSREVMS